MQVVGAPTMADGIAVQRPGDIPFVILGEAGVRAVAVSEAALARALLLCLERAKQVVEPAGAAGRYRPWRNDVSEIPEKTIFTQRGMRCLEHVVRRASRRSP